MEGRSKRPPLNGTLSQIKCHFSYQVFVLKTRSIFTVKKSEHVQSFCKLIDNRPISEVQDRIIRPIPMHWVYQAATCIKRRVPQVLRVAIIVLDISSEKGPNTKRMAPPLERCLLAHFIICSFITLIDASTTVNV